MTNEMPIRVFIVEDHPEVLRMVRKLIRRNPELQVCGEATSAEAALRQVDDCAPGVVLIDVSLPGMDGIELIGILHARYPDVLTLAVSGHSERLYAVPALRAGARGFVLKDELVNVVPAIHQVCGGEIYASDWVRNLITDEG